MVLAFDLVVLGVAFGLFRFVGFGDCAPLGLLVAECAWWLISCCFAWVWFVLIACVAF